MSSTDNPNRSSTALPPARALDLAGLVSYGEAAIVSRTLAKGKAGTMTVFAFDRGQSLSEHTAPFDAYVTVLEGQVKLTIGGVEVAAGTGQTVLMPANVPHAVEAPEPMKMLLVMFRDGGAAE